MVHKIGLGRWWWSLGLAAAGAGTAATVLFRGCWHSNMGWPIQHDENYSYRVCPDCGIKRLYDPKVFRAYGPFGYDLNDLIARAKSRKKKAMAKLPA